MSTKIFNGYKINASSLDEAIKIISNGKKKIIKEYNSSLIKSQVIESCLLMDAFLLTEFEIMKNYFSLQLNPQEKKQDPTSSPMGKAYMSYLDKDSKDKDIDIIIYPEKFAKDPFYLCSLFAGRGMEKIVQSVYAKNMEEYCYYDNTDEPEDISARDWNQRRINWNKATLSKTGIPEIDGLVYKIVKTEMSLLRISDEDRKKMIESCCVMLNKENYFEKRVDIFSQEIMKKIVFHDLCAHDEDIKVNYNKALQIVNKKEFTPQQMEQYQLSQKVLRTILPEKISFELLYKKFETIFEEAKALMLHSQLDNSLLDTSISGKKPKL